MKDQWGRSQDVSGFYGRDFPLVKVRWIETNSFSWLVVVSDDKTTLFDLFVNLLDLGFFKVAIILPFSSSR